MNIVYKITNKINNKVYIGCTTQGLEDRKKEHYSRCFNVGRKSKLCDSLKKHGFDNFEFEIIKECETPEEMFLNEIYYIGFYNSKETGYNLTIGGEGCLGYKHTEETKKHISNLLIENHPHRGKKYEEIYDLEKVEEQKKKRAESVKKYWGSLSEEDKEKRVKNCSIGLKKTFKNKGENNGYSKLTNEQVKEIRELYKNKTYTQKELGKIYSVGQACISSIILNKTYKF